MAFPDGFLWGVATASYQIEGTPSAAGGGGSVWDIFCRRPGAVHAGESGAVACDHFNRYREDVALMAELGVPNYRMSIAWPRVLPSGTGKVDENGLAFYDRLVDELLAKGIQPHVTLFHWDLPIDLYYKGSWLNRDIVGWFEDYAKVVVDKLGDRVASWMTLNEPQVFIGMGYQSGEHAPGDKYDWPEILRIGHHALLAHGVAAQVIRSGAKKGCDLGWAPVGGTMCPASDSKEDIEAARQIMFSCQDRNVWGNTWWNDPIFFGRYPEDGLRMWGEQMPKGWEKDMETIFQTPDFFGMNTYTGSPAKMGEDGPEVVKHRQGIGRTIYHWAVTPEALYWGPRFFFERYGKPIVVTENGIGLSDWVHLDGKVHDPGRIDFLDRYISQFRKAGEDGVAIKGYFQWSFMDNFEWHQGYMHRFGLVYVDYQSQKRIPKDSAYWYRDTIASNGANLKAPAAS
ncbi:MAG TPA: GH1 family beta-glucosidase [Fimbriimonas sp.]